ncbi:MAG: YggS family pyridoxal phosphate-dependent enzyme [Psychroflexus sp.]|uniref:YggS family pyridoxal phosphate-dependent enzyme n=1 Tax=Psychroflexus sp. S27 TaxID=1982757 RepID=UPI000C2AB8B4|nr:YggS family pyridoxal phosphate-dependent enzyme [Psychroflexus sp. S27]PJX20804.1 YggS family pyridoxal phosphate enzyme [Psychroflexus sp. S27]
MSVKIAQNLEEIKSQIDKKVILVAVSKTKPESDIMEAYNAGHRVFGENKIQEMADKYESLPKDIEWHMIGHVQSNKVKYMAPFVTLVHAVHKMKLLKEINKRAKQNNRVIDCLLQVKIADEDSKYGMSVNETEAFLKDERLNNFENVRIKGLMGMATFTDDEEQLKHEFSILQNLYHKLEKEYSEFDTLSMGMSGDYEVAIAHDSNMVRVGSSIFGERNY